MAVVSLPFREKVVTFGEGKSLVGILTIPAEPRVGGAHVVLINAGVIHRVGAHRLYVGFARAFAEAGTATLRFDLSGIGDSERQSGEWTLSLADSVTRDISSALDFLSAEYGAERFVLAGLCSGAFDSFEHAVHDPRVVGAVMIDMPGPFRNWSYFVQHLAVRVLRMASWRTFAKQLARAATAPGDQVQSERDRREAVMTGVRMPVPVEQLDANLHTLLARKVALAFVFTGGVSDYYNHRTQFRLRFPRAAAHAGLCVEFVHWSNHTFSTRKARAYITGFLKDWLTNNAL